LDGKCFVLGNESFPSHCRKKFDFRFWLSHKDLAQILAKNW